MKKFLCMVLMISLMINFGYAKEQYTDLKDPKNDAGREEMLTEYRDDYVYLTSSTQDFNGMGFKSFQYGCRGEDYLKCEDREDKGYAITGGLRFIPKQDGKFSKIEHEGMDIQNYSKTPIDGFFTCDDEECSCYGKSTSVSLYKAYTEEQFKNLSLPIGSSICEHIVSAFNACLKSYEKEYIRESANSKVVYYVYGGMPTGIPAIALVTSIDPGNEDLWVAVFKPVQVRDNLTVYNSGVFQIFDSACNPHIKHTAAVMTAAEGELADTVEYFADVSDDSLQGLAFYEDRLVDGTISVYRFLLACNSCSTCERCIEIEYAQINTYVAYGEIPEFYLSRGCPIHSCCFVYDYPVALPDEYECIKCPDLKLEGEKYIACEDHTCRRWLEHSDYRENFAPQSCTRVVAGRAINDTSSGAKLIRYTGQVDEGVSIVNGKLIIIDGGYSDYCVNHMCNSFFCNEPREDAESYAAKYDKQSDMVTMPNEYCSAHKGGCRVVNPYMGQLQYKGREATAGAAIEQIQQAILEGRLFQCNNPVKKSYYAFIQPDAMICEDCYNKMSRKELNSKNNYFDVGTCPNCGELGVNKFRGKIGNNCVTCIDLCDFMIINKNLSNYQYSNVRGEQRERRCEFNIQRFAGDNTSLCGERCVKGRRYCYWHLCDTDDCVEPVKYNGAYFCEKCVPSL